MNEETQLATINQTTNINIMPVIDLKLAKAQLLVLREFVKEYMVEGEDFGLIPGCKQPFLWKPGADKLNEIYGLAPTYKIISRTVDWDKNLFDYEVECQLISRIHGNIVSSGLGSCSSYEGKYHYRSAQRKCPSCQKETIFKSKADFGGGWYCNKSKGGCGRKFKDGTAEIEEQQTGKILNDDIASLKNTVLKMARKRSLVDATLSATRSSGIFTAGDDDLANDDRQQEKNKPKTTRGDASQPAKTQESNSQKTGEASPNSPGTPAATDGDATPENVPGFKNHLMKAIESLPAAAKAKFRTGIMQATDMNALRDIEVLIQDEIHKS